MLRKLINGEDSENIILNILNDIHCDGPISPLHFETLAYLKEFSADVFAKYEKKLLSLMGLFYKTGSPESILEEVYSMYASSILEETGKCFTPVQADAYNNIKLKKYFSFSAPTSSGKSHLFRALIQEETSDIVIVVPSRALISEYILAVIDLVDSSVLVLQFVENINIDKTQRRIFIITPERGIELFKKVGEFNVGLFLLDEAHISEEPIRGMRFDSFVRRIDRVLPSAKKVFAHPYIDNPEAQLNKHGFSDDSSFAKYEQHSVGKIYLSLSNDTFTYFSPFMDGDQVSEVEAGIDVARNVLSEGGTLLIYTSKDKIISGNFLDEYSRYIDLLPEITDEDALEIIDDLRKFIGASKDGVEKQSLLIDMMKKGIVVHHGSMPLKARLIIEGYIKANYARICFATSTLSQGINMPFDVVWIDNFTNMNALVLKNLIGRAGRTTTAEGVFEYGYVVVKKKNVKTFIRRIKEKFVLSDDSSIDLDISSVPEDQMDIVEAIKEDSFDDDLHLTKSQLSRIENGNIDEDLNYVLDNLFDGGKPITGYDYYQLDEDIRKKIKDSFKNIYISHLRRKSLSAAESSVLSAAIPMMLWHIHGKSFSEIVSLRHAFLSEKDIRKSVDRQVERREMTEAQGRAMLDDTKIRYTPIPSSLPNQDLRRASLFGRNMSVMKIDYDKLVYDTYDYLDKVISFSLIDPLCAAFKTLYDKNEDSRALAMMNYVRYGTVDEMEIWLLKYGFSFDDIEHLKEHIESVDEYKIQFKNTITNLDNMEHSLLTRYL